MKVPILKIKEILLTSIQVNLTDEEALEFQDNVLKMITEKESSGVVIDITAMNVVDSFMARVLNDTVVMAKMLGAEVVISGMQPDVALTLIEMGRELIGVELALNLELAIEKLRDLIQSKEAGDE